MHFLHFVDITMAICFTAIQDNVGQGENVVRQRRKA